MLAGSCRSASLLNHIGVHEEASQLEAENRKYTSLYDTQDEIAAGHAVDSNDVVNSASVVRD